MLLITSTIPTAACPLCQTESQRTHSRYTRHLTDLPWADFKVQIQLRVRRFKCINTECKRVTFAERLGEAIAVYARRTTRLDETIYQIAQHSANARSGAKLAANLNVKVSADTLIRSLKKHLLQTQTTPKVLGVDDWAWKKGLRYGTILIDLERHRVVDLLADRNADTLVAWLQTHPGVEIVSRDRSGAYAEAARRGAPQAQQIADRFHLYKGLGECVGSVVQRNYGQIQTALWHFANKTNTAGNNNPQIVETTTELLPPPPVNPLPLKWHARQKQRRFEHRLALYEQVIALDQKGYRQGEIAEALAMSIDRVAAFLKGGPPQMKQMLRASKVDPYKAYLKKRFFAEGCHNASELWREVCEQGYDGSRSSLVAYVTQLRNELRDPSEGRMGPAPTTQPKVNTDHLHSVREITWWLLKPQEKLKAEAAEKLDYLCEAVEELGQLRSMIAAWKQMFKDKREGVLVQWLDATESSGIKELESFARGLRRDEKAVLGSISSKWSNGMTEGFVNKLKLVKRASYGRAELELLRARMLAAG